MAISANTVWEVRTTGSDNNGGGFVSGSSGTDYSQQDAAQGSGTNLTVDGTTNTDVAPDGYTVASTDVGNLIQITAGTGFTTGFYEIKSIQSGKWRLDRSPAATTTSGGTWAIGGCLATIGKSLSAASGSTHGIWVKAGTYSISSGLTVAPSGLPNVRPMYVMGYQTTRGDNPIGDSRPLVTTSSAIIMMAVNDGYVAVENLVFDGGDVATTGVTYGRRSNMIANITVKRTTTYGFNSVSATGVLLRCEVTDLKAGATAAFSGSSINIYCSAHNTPGIGFYNLEGMQCNIGCIADAEGDAFCGGGLEGPSVLVNCVGRSSTGDGFDNTINTYRAMAALNCIFFGNTGFGIKGGFTESVARQTVDYNAFGSNTSGNRSAVVAGSNDITLTVNPFNDADNGDFSLNSSPGGGAELRGAGFPGTFPGGLTSSYLDIGAAQHYEPTPDEIAEAMWTYSARTLTS